MHEQTFFGMEYSKYNEKTQRVTNVAATIYPSYKIYAFTGIPAAETDTAGEDF
jgi:hypothetical protein